MSQQVLPPVKRPNAIRGGTSRGIMERVERYRVAEKCAAVSEEIIDFWIDCFRNKSYSAWFRNQMALQLMDRAFGRPAMQLSVDETSTMVQKMIHEVRWLPPDPNDTSNPIKPEPD